MARLPINYSDQNTWGTTLNEYLQVAHQADGKLKYTFNVKDYGAKGDYSAGVGTNDTVAIDAAIAACEAAGGGTVYFPKGEYLTDGSHKLTRSNILGAAMTSVRIHNRGATYCFRLSNENSGEQSPAIEKVGIIGSDGYLAAVAGGIGIRVGNGMMARLDQVYVYGFTGTGSVGVQFYRAASTLTYVENTTAVKLAVVNCKACIQFLGTAVETSFGYTNLLATQLQIYADQTAIEVVTGTLYNSLIQGTIHYTGNNGVGFKVGATTGAVWQGAKLDIRGESLGAYTGCKRIVNAHNFVARGSFFIANQSFPDDYSGATSHGFVEDTYTNLEYPYASLASSGVLDVPTYRAAWNVTGTTQINVFSGQTMYEGRVFTLKFASTPVVRHLAGAIHLAGGVNFTAAANNTMTFAYINGVAYEVARSVNT